MVPFIIRLYFTPKIRNIKLKYKRRYNSYLFATGIPLVISTISMTIYSRVNQFSLSYFSGSYELGIYSVALTLGTAWIFIGNAFSISFLSKIYSEKDEFLAKDKTSGLIASVFTVLLVFPVFLYCLESALYLFYTGMIIWLLTKYLLFYACQQ